MIIGIGCDIVEIGRISKMESLDKFVARILSPSEIEVYDEIANNKKITFLAGRFAAKEAFSKALGCGIGTKLSWQDITILNHKSGAPYLMSIALPKSCICHLTIAHEQHYAVAYCVISNS